MALPGKNKISIKEVYNYLMTKPKMTKNKALGIIANIQSESLFYSDAVEMANVKNKGIGLFQHTFPARKKAFLEQVPNWETNWKGQIDFALKEQEAQNYLNSSYKDEEDATKAFMKEFEKPKDQSSKAIQKRIDNLNLISFDDEENIIVSQKGKTDEEIEQQKEQKGYYPISGEEPIEESTLIPEVKIEEDSKSTSKKKYRKDILDRISGRDEYLKYLEDNQDAFKELNSIEKNLNSFSKGTKEYNSLIKKRSELIKSLSKKENVLKEDLYKKELNNYVNRENNARAQLSRLQNEAKAYVNAGEDVPADITKEIAESRKTILESGNRVKLLTKQGWRDYDISPVQQGYNQNILLPDGSIDIEKSKTTPVLPDPLSDDKSDDIVYNVVDEKTDQSQIIETPTEEVTTEEKPTEEVVVEETPAKETPLTKAQKFGQAGSELLKGAGAALDAIGGPGAIISYIMGKKGLKAAMEEVKPQASAELSPMFMQHLRQTRELAKKGFHPDQARKFRKELDKSYQIGLENAVRGSGGQRARFLAQSGVLDAQRSSALLNYAVKDEELQAANQERYEKAMLFKENFDIQQTEKERAEDMERQVANKKSAAGFTSAAFTNLLSGFGRSSLVPNPAPGTTNLLNSITNWGKTEQ
tara:strand:+ start:7217 stop:9145 length:1929 start_codon:yes stop_codon:yes gene_type:complete